MLITRFANLSNGLLLAADGLIEPPFGFVRIQSTACEQKRWAHIINDLDHTFLLPLALGLEVTVYDMGAKKEFSRAIYQGLPWIRYACARMWDFPRFVCEDFADVRGNNVIGYFDEVYRQTRGSFEAKLRYYERFAPTKLLLIGSSRATLEDCKETQVKAAKKLGGAS